MQFNNNLIHRVANFLLNRGIRIGTNTYRRRLLLPNLLSRSLGHEEHLDDIYNVVLDNKEGAIIDVGANTGQTLLKMLNIDKNRSYYGFEPQSTAASCVEIFLIDNKIANHTIMPIALSDHNGSMPISTRGEGICSLASSVASTVDGFRPKNFYSHTKYIYAAHGDEIIGGLCIPSIALIKIDVEGAELEVVRGLTATIEKHRPFILFEVLHHYLVATEEELDKRTIDFRESRIQEVEEIVRSRGYHVFQIYGAKEVVKIRKIKPMVANDLSTTDFLAVPEEKERDFCLSLETCRIITTN
jgi:FkbM family methyltransferase